MQRTIATACALALNAAFTLAGAQGDGKAAYDAQCRKCHGANGTPPAAMVKRFKRLAALDAKLLGKVSESSIVAVVTKGMGDLKALTGRMPAGDIKAVAKYAKEMAAASR
jgi:mono/diheme cytochrome c family protein